MKRRPNGFFTNMSNEQLEEYVEKNHCNKLISDFHYSDSRACAVARKRGLIDSLVQKRILIRTRKQRRIEIKPSKEELQRLYVVECKDTEDIARRYEVTSTTICGWMDEYEIARRNRKEVYKIKFGDKMPPKEELQRLYNQERKTTDEIAKVYGVARSTAWLWLDQSGIKIRDSSDAHYKKGFVRPTKEELRKMHWDERKSVTQIANELNGTKNTVARLFKEFAIPIRSLSEQRLPAGFVKPTKEELYDSYKRQGKSREEIAKELGVSASFVIDLLNQYKIPVRGVAEAKAPKGFVRPTKEELQRMHWDERKSVTQIARELGVCFNTIKREMDKVGIHKRPSINLPTKEELKRMYEDEKLNLKQIAKKIGCSVTPIFLLFERYGIPRRHSTASTNNSVSFLEAILEGGSS